MISSFLVHETNFFALHTPNFLVHIKQNIETNNKNYEVEHFFTHCLIVKPDKAFDENNFMAKDYERDCLTYLEFEKILQCLYDTNSLS